MQREKRVESHVFAVPWIRLEACSKMEKIVGEQGERVLFGRQQSCLFYSSDGQKKASQMP